MILDSADLLLEVHVIGKAVSEAFGKLLYIEFHLFHCLADALKLPVDLFFSQRWIVYLLLKIVHKVHAPDIVLFQEAVEDNLYVANTLTEYTDSVKEPTIYLLLKCSLYQNVVYIDELRFLTKTVHTSDSLLNNHWVPRQVIIYDSIAELHIKTLTSDFRRKKYIDALTVLELLDSISPFLYTSINQQCALFVKHEPML